MRQLLLSVALVAAPVGVFAVGYRALAGASQPVAAAQAQGLGDLGDLGAIVADTQAIAAKGDLSAAQKRITDFETAWDDAQPRLQPKNPEQWGVIDEAADRAIKSLRTAQPVAAEVGPALAGLAAALENPAVGAASGAGGVQKVGNVAVTDAGGRPLPCEGLLKQLAVALGASQASAADRSAATDFQQKATERCNADDDQRADAFSAQGLGLLGR
ncbi:MAG: hypothetical protein U1E48_06295 [Paracoccaceae bacterium]